MKNQNINYSLRALVAAMALTTVATGFARKLTPEEAISRANEFQQATASTQVQAPNRIIAHGNAMQADKMSLVYTAENVGTEKIPAFYVFNTSATQDGGFIIASGDDRLRPVLAMVDNGNFDPENLPESLKWWLSEYEKEINAFLSSTSSIAAPSITASTADYYYDNYASWSTISPMVTTTWNQGDPYNAMCPTYNGGVSVTGCVATAMAQVINYHKYAKGKGTHTYKPANWTTSSTVTYDFANAEFDWDNMLDSYDGRYSTTQKNAVANLMFACGVAVDMQYSPELSGAYSPANGLIEYLGYHEKTAEISRSVYQSAEWEAMIYKELSQNRPVIYSGATTEGGHAFVCDGYSQNGYFHINWGWGGYCDGYFTLSALTPEGQGIGGFEGGYNGGQGFVRIITPNDPYLDEFEESRYGVKCESGFKHVSSSGTSETFNNSLRLWWAPSYPTSLRYAVCVVGEDGSEVYLASTTSSSLSQFATASARNYSVNFGSANLAAGKYKVYPAYYATSTNQYGRAFYDGGKPLYVNMTVGSDGKRTFSTAEKFNIEVSGIEIDSQIYQESTSTLAYTFTNSGENDLLDEVECALGSYTLTSANTILRAGESVTFQTNIRATTPSGTAIPAGSYKLVFKGKNSGETFSSPTVNVTVVAGRDPSLPAGDQVITSLDRMPTEWLNGEEIEIPIDYLATKAGSVTLHYMLYPRDSEIGPYNFAYFWVNAYSINIPEGTGSLGSAIFTPDKDLPAGEYDFFFDNYPDYTTPISPRVPITVGLTSDDITYRLAVDGTFARAARLEPTSATEISIPASVATSSKSYPVKEISTEMMTNNSKVTRVNFPASVTEICADAFQNVSALKYLFFDGETVPVQSASSAFSGCGSNMEVYVPGDAWSGYNSAFRSLGKVYAKITDIKVDNITIKKGETVNIDITTTPAQNTNPNYTVSISSDDIATAKVENGKLVVTGVENGAATITLTSAQPGVNPVEVKVTVSDQNVPAESITLDKETLELTVGETATLTATVAPDDTTDKTVTWTSDNEEVATVDAEGKVTAIAAGEAVITATCGEASAECKVTVNPAVVNAESITLDKETLELNIGETAVLTATVTPDDTTDKTVTWTSSNEDVATVNANGKVIAIAAGEAVITATCGEATAECKVTVNSVITESIILDKETLELTVGETAVLTATVTTNNTTDETVTWSSSNDKVATVDAEGKVTAIAAGEAVITASFGELSADCKVTVNPAVVDAESITLDKETLELNVGETATLTATIAPEDATDKTVTWSSSNDKVATVDANGKVTAIAAGEAVITATCGKLSADCKVTVIYNSGIDAAQANEPIITLSHMTINVSGVADDCNVSVYTLIGELIASETGCCSISVANRGVYIVKVGAKAVKVSVTR